MVIVDPGAGDDKVGQVADRIKAIVAEHGGEDLSVDLWGRRKMAYEIRSKAEGQYVVVAFRSEASALPELERVLSFTDEVMRFKIVRPDAA